MTGGLKIKITKVTLVTLLGIPNNLGGPGSHSLPLYLPNVTLASRYFCILRVSARGRYGLLIFVKLGEKTVRCPSCKSILDVENAESSILRPCLGCGTMLGNPTNALKVTKTLLNMFFFYIF